MSFESAGFSRDIGATSENLARAYLTLEAPLFVSLRPVRSWATSSFLLTQPVDKLKKGDIHWKQSCGFCLYMGFCICSGTITRQATKICWRYVVSPTCTSLVSGCDGYFAVYASPGFLAQDKRHSALFVLSRRADFPTLRRLVQL